MKNISREEFNRLVKEDSELGKAIRHLSFKKGQIISIELDVEDPFLTRAIWDTYDSGDRNYIPIAGCRITGISAHKLIHIDEGMKKDLATTMQTTSNLLKRLSEDYNIRLE